MDDGKLGEYTQVYIGTNRPDLTEYTVYGLTTGLPYRFTVQALNSNGYSDASSAITLYACDKPAGLAAPSYVSSDKDALTISLSWNAPPDDGGCPVTGFEVYVDDGTTGIPTTKVTSVADSDPSINTATVTFTQPSGTSIVGNIYTFAVRAINAAGYVESSTTKIALASLPSKPTTAPQSDTSVTNTQTLKVLITVFDDTLSGGSQITRYEVQIDDGNNGEFRSIYTLSPSLTFTSGISRGEQYRVRYRAENANGWGPFSDTALLKAATVPSKPSAPIYDATNSDSTKIYLGFVPPSDNGGAEITSYRLYMDEVATTSNPQNIATTTDLFYEVDATTHSLVSGTTYRFYLVAVNEFGPSENSEETRAALGTYPGQPNAPYKVESESTLTSITIAWAAASEVYSTPISGYYLYGDGGSGGNLVLVYDGSTKPNTLSHTIGGLTTGIPYRFAISALNVNGESPLSDSVEIYACLKPEAFSAPYKISSSKTSVSIGWTEPNDNGCPIQSYSIFRDDGSGGAIEIAVDASTVNNKPSLREYQITGLSPAGSTFRFKLRATNSAGSTDSSHLSIILASVPDTPSTGPISDASVTDDTRIKVDYSPLLSANNGGSTILSYSIEMDNGKGGSFVSLAGGISNRLATTYTIATGIQSGVMYRFRYRAKNVAGWSAYSPITYIKAAAQPVRPPAPIFVTATATYITLTLPPTLNVRGSPITQHELFVNGGGSSNTYTNVTSYSGEPGDVTIPVTSGGLVAGSIYKFKHRAVNEVDKSDFSNTIDAGVSDFPDQPAAPTIGTLGETSITLSWVTSADKDLPVIGYQLYMDDGYGGDYSIVYDGKNFPNVRQFTVTGLSRGLVYNFKVTALNFNGASVASDATSVTFCSDLTGLSAPTLLSSTETSLTLQWTAPEHDGGCPVLEYTLKRDDGSGTAAAVDTIVDASDFTGEPSKREHTVTFTSSDTSKSYKFQLFAKTITEVSSEVVTFVVAAAPNAPSSAPTSDLTETSGSQIKVVYAALATADNGGSDITSYELQMYDFDASTWESLIGNEDDISLSNSFIVTEGITIGNTYEFRYRAFNVNGASGWSDIGYLVAAEAPSQPSAPEYASSDDTSVTLSFRPPSSDGGSIITNYILQYSEFSTLNWNTVTTYTDNSMSHTVTVSSGLVTAHAKYRFRIMCENAFGTSDPSNELVVAIASLPSKPNAPTKVQSGSSKTSIKIQWDALADSQPVVGYYVYMADISSGGSYSLIYDGSANPIRRKYTANLLTSGKSYGFKVQAVNFNGKGEFSTESIFVSCEAPAGLAVPVVESVTETTITLSWKLPTSNGGCSTTGFSLWMDDGAGGSIVETDATIINDRPYLRRYTKIFAATETGKSFRFRLQAFNAIDSVFSSIVSVVLADEPTTPSTGPIIDSSNTNDQQIGVTWNAVTGTGGSPITSYELQMSLLETNEFISIVGYSSSYLDLSYIVTQNITKGKDHRFRYRAKNIAGWSGFSPISFIRAATVPDAPDKPILLSRTSTSVQIGMTQTLDDGGSPVESNKLYIGDLGQAFSAYTLVASYDGTSSEYTFNTADSPSYITTGSIYKIAYIASNEFGDSEYLTELTVGVGAAPPAPTNFIEASSSSSTAKVIWDKVTTSDLPVLGYIVQMDDGLGGDFSVVYDGQTNPQVSSYTAEGLEPGRDYIFKVQAVDINGAGTETLSMKSQLTIT